MIWKIIIELFFTQLKNQSGKVSKEELQPVFFEECWVWLSRKLTEKWIFVAFLD